MVTSFSLLEFWYFHQHFSKSDGNARSGSPVFSRAFASFLWVWFDFPCIFEVVFLWSSFVRQTNNAKSLWRKKSVFNLVSRQLSFRGGVFFWASEGWVFFREVSPSRHMVFQKKHSILLEVATSMKRFKRNIPMPMTQMVLLVLFDFGNIKFGKRHAATLFHLFDSFKARMEEKKKRWAIFWVMKKQRIFLYKNKSSAWFASKQSLFKLKELIS